MALAHAIIDLQYKAAGMPLYQLHTVSPNETIEELGILCGTTQTSLKEIFAGTTRISLKEIFAGQAHVDRL